MDWSNRLDIQSGTGLPLYYQLREQLRSVIGATDPDTQLPTEREIMHWAGVSRATARRALADLVQEGLLVSRQGKGTFTAPRRVRAELGRRPLGFTEAILRAGRRPGTQMLEFAQVPAPDTIASQLAIPAGTDVFVIERLRLIDDDPAMIERAYLAAHLFPGLADCDLTGSLYETLRERYGRSAAHGEETILAVNADHQLARRLHVPIAAALLATARRTYADDGTPLEYTLRHARGDACSFYVELRDTVSVMSHYSIAEPVLDDLVAAGRS